MSSMKGLWTHTSSSSSSSTSDEYTERRSEEEAMFGNEIMEFETAESSATTQGGSVMGRKDLRRGRDYAGGHNQLIRDYFASNPVYDEVYFRKRFRMSKTVFNRVIDRVSEANIFFTHRRNGINELGVSPLQKVTAALRMLSYGTSGDSQDDKIRIGDSTAVLCLKEFCKTVVRTFGEQYLRTPTARDIDRLLAMGSQRGFPGMLGSLDCMHWTWKNCPVALQGQYRGHCRRATLVLEAVASFDLYIWHAFFGAPGSLNDINVLRQSYLFNDLYNDLSPPCNYWIGDKQHTVGYYLVDGIYPKWKTLVQAYKRPNNAKEAKFTKQQESYRKDVERAFGVLQGRFHILRQEVHYHDQAVLSDIMYCCIILHNMIVEEERGGYALQLRNYPDIAVEFRKKPYKDPNTFAEYLQRIQEVRDPQAHLDLREELVEHLWEHMGNQQ